MTELAVVADPWGVLGVVEGAAPEVVRAAYLRLLRDHGPDDDPEAFERIRDAWDELRDPRRRAERLLLSVDPEVPLVQLVDAQPAPRRFAGPKVWLDAVRAGCR